MMNRIALRAAVGGLTVAAASAMAIPAFAATGPSASNFGQVAAAAVHVTAPVNQAVGTVGAPIANVNVPCPAPWWQGGVLGAKYNACNTAVTNQQDIPGGSWASDPSDRDASGFGQVAAAPVWVGAPINQLVGTVGAPLANVNVPCPAPWNQGGVLGAKYNACNTAPVNQQG
jgi:hypothetical protein